MPFSKVKGVIVFVSQLNFARRCILVCLNRNLEQEKSLYEIYNLKVRYSLGGLLQKALQQFIQVNGWYNCIFIRQKNYNEKFPTYNNFYVTEKYAILLF